MATKEEYSDQEFDARSLFVNSTSLMQSDTRKGFSQPLNAANGGEFLVNEFTEGHQWSPSVARLVNGNVVVAWDSFDGRQGDASDRAVKARVLDANGNEVVSEFLVNEITSGVQATPAVTALTNGNFAISWMSSVGDGSGGAIRARIFDTGGQEVVGEFPVNQVALGSQTQPAIASLDNGNFVVSWQSQGNPPSYSDIKARVFNANGEEVTGEFLVNQFTHDNQSDPDITALDGDEFAITWSSFDLEQGDSDGSSVKARLFEENGEEATSEFLVNEFTEGSQLGSSITTLSNGNLVITWTSSSYGSDPRDREETAINARIIDQKGDEIVDEFLVNEITTSGQYGSYVTALNDGGFVVSWWSYDQQQGDDSGTGIKARVFDAMGQELVSEFLVNELTDGSHYSPVAQALNADNYIVVWQSENPQQGDDSGYGVKARILDANESPNPPLPTPPVAVDDSYEINAAAIPNAGATLDILNNDLAVTGSLDSNSVLIVDAPDHGQAAVTNGKLLYKPNPGFEGQDVLEYTVADASGLDSDPATVLVHVDQPDRPTANDDSYTIDALEVGKKGVKLNVLANDTAFAGSLVAKSIEIIDGPDHGKVKIDKKGKLYYKPKADFDGEDSFDYTVADKSHLESDPATVLVQVNQPDPPTANDDSYTINALAVGKKGVKLNILGNDEAVTGSLVAKTIDILDSPDHGKVKIDKKGKLYYKPKADFDGEDSFDYTVADKSHLDSDPATVLVQVNQPDPPTANDDSYTMDALKVGKKGVKLNILANDEAVTGSLVAKTIDILDGPDHGKVTVDKVGKVYYKPARGFGGEDEFTYTVEDKSHLDSDPATVLVQVNQPDPPQANDDSYSINAKSIGKKGIKLNILANDEASTGSLVAKSIEIVDDPDHGRVKIDKNGKVFYKLKSGSAEEDGFTYTVADKSGLDSNPATVQLEIDRPVRSLSLADVLDSTPDPASDALTSVASAPVTTMELDVLVPTAETA